jgi:hypothetical protein
MNDPADPAPAPPPQKTVAQPGSGRTLPVHMDSSAATPRSPWALTFAITIGFMVAFVIAGADLYFKTTILEQGDIAVNALQIDNAKRGTEIYGNYSRYLFNHPGPAFFYVYAAGEIVLRDWLELVPSPHNAHLLALLLLQIGCFALAVGLVHAWIGSWTFVALALLGGVWHFSLARYAFTSIWPPHVLLMPFLCFITAASSFAAGRRQEMITMLILGGFLFHGHVAQPLFVGGLGALGFFLHYRHLKASGTWTGVLGWLRANRLLVLGGGVVIAIFLLPLLLDLTRYGLRGNLMTIVRRFIHNTEEWKSSLQSLLYFLSFPTYASNQEHLFSTLGPETYAFFRQHATGLSAWAVFLTVPGIFALFRAAKLPAAARRFMGTAYPILGATFLLCLVWGKMQAGPMFQFNGYFYFGVYYFAGLLSIGIVCSIPGRLLPLPVTAALCGIAGISASWLFRAPRLNPEETGAILQQGIDAALAQDPSPRTKLLVFEHRDWPEAASVALVLQRRGIPFAVSNFWTFMFGRQNELHLLGPAPATKADTWWISRPGPQGSPLGNNVHLFTQPAAVDPTHTQISFAGGANGFRFLINGVSVGNTTHTLTEDRVVTFKFRPMAATRDVQVTFDADCNRRPNASSAQPAVVTFNGRTLGTLTASQREPLSLIIPRELWNSAPDAVLELTFPEAAYFQFYYRPGNDTWFAWSLWTITFQSAN